MAIQDELSDMAKKVIIECVSEALEKHITNCSQGVADELAESGYGVTMEPGHVRLSPACIGEIRHILGTDFFN